MNSQMKLPLAWIVAFPTPPAQRYYGPFGVGEKYAAVLSYSGKNFTCEIFTAEQLVGIQSEPYLYLRFNISMIPRLASVFVNARMEFCSP